MATAPDISDDPRARVGGNRPPSIKEQALTEAAEILKPLLDRGHELLNSAKEAHANDADGAGKCADLVKMIRACDAELDAKRKEVQKPYDEAVKVIMDIPRAMKLSLSTAKVKVADLAADFDRRERKRLREEEEQRQAEQQRQTEAMADRAKQMGVELPPEEPVKEPARTKPQRTFSSDMGSSTYTRKVDVYAVTDPYALPLDILNHEKVVEAIISVARGMRQANPETPIKGIIITQEDRAVIR